MEFRFDLHPIFSQPLIKVNSNLLPIGFRGDRRMALDTATKMAEIINEIGEASARAQGLSNPVTTAQKLRMTDQTLYLLADLEQGKYGAVIGLLKVGNKSLYVFDENGQTQNVNCPCVLDFYVHESRQRAGLGKDLFETMLHQENFRPEKMAVDRPSDKLLGFLRKHYGLQKTIPQMNNFVVYEGFFDRPAGQNSVNSHDSRMHITASPNTALFGPQYLTEEQKRRVKAQQNASNTSIPLIQNSPVGRYAAPRPMCSMAEIIHNTATPATGEPNSLSHYPSATEPYHSTVIHENAHLDTVRFNIENLQLSGHDENGESEVIIEHHVEPEPEHNQGPDSLSNGNDLSHKVHKEVRINDQHFVDEEVVEPTIEPVHLEKPTSFLLNKQHTGLKNISYNVGLAVSPTSKMDFIPKESNGDRHTQAVHGLPVDKPAGMPSHDTTDPAAESSSPGGAGYTDHGYFDLKFYHNRLW